MRLRMCFACTDFVDLTRVRVCNPYVMRRVLTTCIFILMTEFSGRYVLTLPYG